MAVLSYSPDRTLRAICKGQKSKAPAVRRSLRYATMCHVPQMLLRWFFPGVNRVDQR